ncbi:pyridoxamine 5'-phosphate oxidase family protein [Glycomyces harbinensis]|uniref:Pyridoxamine 5'-phosphate oxidase n=1 Tax=Glycomyces harbinensis TaxID=58114 RepID=A0A1G6XMT9_9ACTN|nr:pyridoxamine 5'-phosphate oxidase family protein [Glycomyces harbinensis]SDD79514.1 Pyridoxamine 5'-phosphate oxidase [Glycomyces harbinensis]
MENRRIPVELDPKLALGLLGHAEFGRVAFNAEGRPTIRPLNHVVVDGQIIVCTGHSSAFAKAVRDHAGLQVAYQADEIGLHTRLGWSVLVTGTAADITAEHRAERLGPQVRSWIDRPLDTVIAISPQNVTGLRLTVG